MEKRVKKAGYAHNCKSLVGIDVVVIRNIVVFGFTAIELDFLRTETAHERDTNTNT